VQLARIHRLPLAEVWLQPVARWPAICTLINAEADRLMYLRFEGDAGFATRNPIHSGPPGTTIEYYLSNGQRDEYPVSSNITTNEAWRALRYFFPKREMCWLQWHKDR
jgi:hypothetical protein